MSRCSLKYGGRDKAWLGIVLSLASTAASLYNNYKNRQAQTNAQNNALALQNQQAEQQNLLAQNTAQANSLNNYYAMEKQFKPKDDDLVVANGGRISLKSPSFRIDKGGYAIPLDNHTFLLRGRSHAKGGIDVTFGHGNKKVPIEAEGGEIIWDKDPRNSIVFSRKLGYADAVLAGGNKPRLAAMQQIENGDNRTSPVKGKRASFGTLVNTMKGVDWVNLGSNLATSIGSGLIDDYFNSKVNTKVVAPEYFEQSPITLNKNMRIGATLASLNRLRLSNNRNIAENSFNSQAALARMRKNNYDVLEKEGELYDAANNFYTTQSNKETEMNSEIARNNITNRLQHSRELADALNRQTELENNKLLRRSQIGTKTLASINSSIGNFIDTYNQRLADEDSMKQVIALGDMYSPGTAERLTLAGVDLPYFIRAGLYNKYKNNSDQSAVDIINTLKGTFNRRQRKLLNING